VADIVANDGNPSATADAARIAFEAAARHCRSVDDRDGESQSWSHLGELSLLVGAIDAASDAYRRSLDVAVDLPRNRVFSAVGLYRVAIRKARDAMTERDVEPAARLLLDALKEAPGLAAVVARKIGEEMAHRPTMGPEEAALQAELSASTPMGRSD
jgi:hypothetical protein